jgi:hypothetical protein
LPPKPSPGAEAPEPPGPHLSLARLSAVITPDQKMEYVSA